MKNLIFLSKVLILLCFITVNNSCEDIDDNIVLPKAEDIVTKGSELYSLLERVTNSENDPMHDIVCIDIVYPLRLNVYDQNLHPINTITIIGDENFSNFLGELPNNQYLSISYPISTTLSDGTEFTVNNNTELKLAIDSCSKEDIITYCTGIFFTPSPQGYVPCIWKIQYNENTDNKYLGGYFEVNQDCTLKFHYDNQEYIGNWIFLFINNEIHLNINLEGSSQVALDWNIDRKINVTPDDIIIENDPKKIHLRRACQTTANYEIGDEGPGGGIVFYDKGNYSYGWRYIEVSTNDLPNNQWGCANSSVEGTNNSEIGKGLLNSSRILNFHDTLLNFYTNPSICDISNDGTVAVKSAFEYSNNELKDWFLPSHDELYLIYTNLHLQSLGSLSNNLYWSSTENDTTTVKAIDFSNGEDVNCSKVTNLLTVKIRCIRYF